MDYSFPEKFHKAVEFVESHFGDIETATKLDDGQRLVFYALRQQTERGPCTDPSPPLWQMRERYKHQAWKKLGNSSQFEAMVLYVRFLDELLGGSVDWVAQCRAKDAAAQQQNVGISLTTSDLTTDRDMWDIDLAARSSPTEHNIVYMASQIMYLRKVLSEQCGAVIDSSTAPSTRQEASPTPKPKQLVPELLQALSTSTSTPGGMPSGNEGAKQQQPPAPTPPAPRPIFIEEARENGALHLYIPPPIVRSTSVIATTSVSPLPQKSPVQEFVEIDKDSIATQRQSTSSHQQVGWLEWLGLD